MKIDFQRKASKLKERQPNEFKQLRYSKLIGEVVKKILKNNSKILKKNDLSEICIKVYGSTNKIKEIRVRKVIESAIAKQDIDNELRRIYSDAGLDKEELKVLLSDAKQWIKEKKDITNALKLAQMIGAANNLDHNNSVKATYRETTDFSKIGKDGQPVVKTSKTLEITKNEATGTLESTDPVQGNDNVSPEKVD